MEHAPESDSLHRLVADALERGARAQQQSRLLVADHRDVDAALRDTLAAIRDRQRSAAAQQPPQSRC